MPDGCLVSDPRPGVQVEERVCPRSGQRTVAYHVFIPGDPDGRENGWWEWVCTGLTAEEHAAGK